MINGQVYRLSVATEEGPRIADVRANQFVSNEHDNNRSRTARVCNISVRLLVLLVSVLK